MKWNKLKPILFVGCLLFITCGAIVYASKGGPFGLWPPPVVSGKNSVVSLSGNLTQNKVLYGGEGITALALTLTADEILDLNKGKVNHVDIVIVIDRSGSMQGKKIRDAKHAALKLLSRLSVDDRFGIVTYSDGVQRCSSLVRVTSTNRERLQSIVRSISVGGATNLGAGLQEGIDVLLSARKSGNGRRVILISDGLANRGITNLNSLGNMAAISVEKEFAVSTVGVGSDFNEHLMTHIADRGSGNYYYLENPKLFAEVFNKEFNQSRTAVATSVEVKIPLANGISVVDASGYPIQLKKNEAVIQTGNLLSGQVKKIFLTLRVPTHKQQTLEIGNISGRYYYQGHLYVVEMTEPFQIACVKDQLEVYSSIDENEWEEKVLNEDLNKLKEEVAKDLKKGEKKEALTKIEKYYEEQQTVNSVVASPSVAASLERDLGDLRDVVEDTFQGKPQEVQLKQKNNAKALQYEGYRGRRSKAH